MALAIPPPSLKQVVRAAFDALDVTRVGFIPIDDLEVLFTMAGWQARLPLGISWSDTHHRLDPDETGILLFDAALNLVLEWEYLATSYACGSCTFVNRGDACACVMCQTLRPPRKLPPRDEDVPARLISPCLSSATPSPPPIDLVPPLMQARQLAIEAYASLLDQRDTERIAQEQRELQARQEADRIARVDSYQFPIIQLTETQLHGVMQRSVSWLRQTLTGITTATAAALTTTPTTTTAAAATSTTFASAYALPSSAPVSCSSTISSSSTSSSARSSASTVPLELPSVVLVNMDQQDAILQRFRDSVYEIPIPNNPNETFHRLRSAFIRWHLVVLPLVYAVDGEDLITCISNIMSGWHDAAEMLFRQPWFDDEEKRKFQESEEARKGRCRKKQKTFGSEVHIPLASSASSAAAAALGDPVDHMAVPASGSASVSVSASASASVQLDRYSEYQLLQHYRYNMMQLSDIWLLYQPVRITRVRIAVGQACFDGMCAPLSNLIAEFVCAQPARNLAPSTRNDHLSLCADYADNSLI